jgi:endonuclease/exonuclease/phosphatase (EEP) superfamily protein YafD
MPQHSISGVRPVLARVCWVLAWAFVAALGLTTVFRLAAWDKFEVFAILDAFTLTLFLPAWPIAVIAAWRRHWLLFAAAGAMVVTHIVLVAPEILASTALPPLESGSTVLRVFDANVYQDNPSMAGYAREIRVDKPDVVTLEEASEGDLRQLVASHAFDGLRYVFTNNAFGSRALVIASRYPLAPTVESSVDGQLYLARTVVTIGPRRLALWVVHTTAPTDPGVGQWNDELDGVVRILHTDRPRPLLLLGDFNATWGNRGFRAILSTGLTDGAAARGQDFDMTWSQMTSPLPPMVRIDHVLTGPGVEVTAIHTEPGPGRDHRALAATVAVLGIRSAPR